MSDPARLLLDHDYAFLFLAVAAEQIGLPIPAIPVLIMVGALAGFNLLHFLAVLALAIAACLIADSIWYLLGKRRGGAILGLLCRISLEPDTCVSNMHSSYARYGARSLLFAKFVPALGMLAPPMAGAVHLAPWKFLALDTGGALAWSGAYLALGWIFRAQLENLFAILARFGASLAILIAAALALYIGFKYLQRRRVYRALRIARISAIDLRQKMDAGEKLAIVDLRNPIEWREGWIPGSLHVAAGNLDSLIPAIAGTEVILYCSCPNEAGSARAALRLKRRGVRSVRPLDGGFARWMELGFPITTATSV